MQDVFVDYLGMKNVINGKANFVIQLFRCENLDEFSPSNTLQVFLIHLFGIISIRAAKILFCTLLGSIFVALLASKTLVLMRAHPDFVPLHIHALTRSTFTSIYSFSCVLIMKKILDYLNLFDSKQLALISQKFHVK